MANELRVAQKVRVGVEIGRGQIVQFYSYIKGLSSDRLLLVFSESKKHFIPYLTEGKNLRLSIYTPIGILLMNSIILSAPKGCEFEVEFSNEQKRIQRRRYLRAQANYRLIVEQNNKMYTALTEDIGGGGVRFICDEPLQLIEAESRLFIPEAERSILFSGCVAKKDYFKPNEYLIEFEKIDEADRNKILQKCLELEAKENKEI